MGRRRLIFTKGAIAQIPRDIEHGLTREDIALRLGTTVKSLGVTIARHRLRLPRAQRAPKPAKSETEIAQARAAHLEWRRRHYRRVIATPEGKARRRAQRRNRKEQQSDYRRRRLALFDALQELGWIDGDYNIVSAAP